MLFRLIITTLVLKIIKSNTIFVQLRQNQKICVHIETLSQGIWFDMLHDYNLTKSFRDTSY